MAAGMSVAGIAILAGPASAHDLTGGSTNVTCVGDTASVTWNFKSANAGTHVITSVKFDRAVSSSSFTANTVTAHTTEPVGKTVSLTASVLFEDNYPSSYKVTATIPGDICPPPTTTTVPPTTTTVPPPTTTVPPTTTPVTTTPVTTTPVTTTPVTTPPTTAAPTTAPTVLDTVAVAATPKPVAAVPATLPTTGSSSTVVVVAGIGALLVGALLLVAGRRGHA